MNTIIVFAALLAVALAQPLGDVAVSQDTVGNYNLRYNTDDATRSEQGFQDGKVVGTFTFKDKEGGSHTINYISSPNGGFTAQGDIPRPVQETPEVAAARATHLAVVAKERALLPPLREQEILSFAPSVQFIPTNAVRSFEVDNTAELEAARAQHFAAHQVALADLADAYRKAPPSF